MDLYSTLRALIALLKMLNNTTLTKGVQAFCDSSGLDQVSTANRAGDVSVEISDQVLSLVCHLDSKGHRGQEISSCLQYYCTGGCHSDFILALVLR